MTKGRRQLRFANLDQVVLDVETLLAGHRTLGRWSLAQICNHLSSSIIYNLDGFPGRHAPWLVQKTLGKAVLRIMLGTERILEGMRLPAAYHPVADLDVRREADGLRAAIH